MAFGREDNENDAPRWVSSDALSLEPAHDPTPTEPLDLREVAQLRLREETARFIWNIAKVPHTLARDSGKTAMAIAAHEHMMRTARLAVVNEVQQQNAQDLLHHPQAVLHEIPTPAEIDPLILRLLELGQAAQTVELHEQRDAATERLSLAIAMMDGYRQKLMNDDDQHGLAEYNAFFSADLMEQLEGRTAHTTTAGIRTILTEKPASIVTEVAVEPHPKWLRSVITAGQKALALVGVRTGATEKVSVN